MAQNSTRPANGEQGDQFNTSGVPPLMSSYTPWPSYSQYHGNIPGPTQEFWRDDCQFQSSWPAQQQWFRPPLLGFAPPGYGDGAQGTYQPNGSHQQSQGSRSQFHWKRQRSSEGDPRQLKKSKGGPPHQKHQKQFSKNDARKPKPRSPPASSSTGSKKTGKTPSKAAKEDERRATVAKVMAHVRNSARKDLNMKLLEKETTATTRSTTNSNRSSVKEAVADIQLTAEDFRSIGSCTKQPAKPTSTSSVVLQDIGFIDPSPDLNSGDFSSFQVVDEWAPETSITEETPPLNSKSPELITEAASSSSATEQHDQPEQNPADVLKMKQQVLHKILTMDRLKRTQLIEDPKSSSSKFVIDHLVKEHRTAVSRRLTQLRFHVDVEAHTLYNEIGGTFSEVCDDLDISQLPEALLEQVQEIITSEKQQSAVVAGQEDEEILILETPAKPPPPCIDLDEVVEEERPALRETETQPQEITPGSADLKQDEVPDSYDREAPAPVETPSVLAALALALAADEPSEQAEERAAPECPVSEEDRVASPAVAETEFASAMETLEAADGIDESMTGVSSEHPPETTAESRSSPATVSRGEPAAVLHTHHLKILKDLFKQEQNQYAALKSLDKIEKKILAKRQNVMKSLARLKKRQFEVLTELQMNRQPPVTVEEHPDVDVSSREAVGGAAAAEETPGTSEETQVQQTLAESNSRDVDSHGLTTAQEIPTQGASTSTTTPQPRLLELVNQLTADGFRVSVEDSESRSTPVSAPPQRPATSRRRTTSSRGEDSVTSLRADSTYSCRQERSSRYEASTKTAAQSKEDLAAQSLMGSAYCSSQAKGGKGDQEQQLAYRPLLSHKGSVECLHAVGPVLFTGSADKMVHVYDVESRCLMQRIDVHKGPVKFVYALPLRTPTHLLPAAAGSAQYLGHLDVITGCADGFVRRIDMSTSRVVHEITTRYPVTCMVRTHPQSRVFLLGAVLGYIYQYNPKHAHLQLTDYKADCDVICLVVTQLLARKVVVISAKNCPVVIRDYRSGILLLTLHLGPSLRRICAVSTLGDYVYCADAARNIIVCDSANSGAVVREIKLPTCAMKICENDKLMYLGCYDGVVRVLDTTSLAIVKNIAVYNRKDLTCMQIEDDKKIYLGNRAGEVGYLEGVQR